MRVTIAAALLEGLGTTDNTIVLAMAANGLMHLIHPATKQNGVLPGGKNDVSEGGIPVLALAERASDHRAGISGR